MVREEGTMKKEKMVDISSPSDEDGEDNKFVQSNFLELISSFCSSSFLSPRFELHLKNLFKLIQFKHEGSDRFRRNFSLKRTEQCEYELLKY